MAERDGGEGGIRTHGPLSRSPVFKTGALNRSATSPFILTLGSEGLIAAHVGPEGAGYADLAARLLAVLDDRDQGAADREP